jgi:hypothetical protein
MMHVDIQREVAVGCVYSCAICVAVRLFYCSIYKCTLLIRSRCRSVSIRYNFMETGPYSQDFDLEGLSKRCL